MSIEEQIEEWAIVNVEDILDKFWEDKDTHYRLKRNIALNDLTKIVEVTLSQQRQTVERQTKQELIEKIKALHLTEEQDVKEFRKIVINLIKGEEE